MKNKKKRTLKLFGTLDVVAIEEYLESMAAKGWIFGGCKGMFYTFDKGKPQKLNYHVSLFHDGSAFGSVGDNIETKKYAAEWEAQGWQYVYANGRQVFFVSEDTEAEVISVEPKEHLATVKKCINGEIISGLVWIALCLMNLFTLNNAWPTEFMENSTLDLCWVVLFIFWTGTLFRNILFYLNNKKRVTKGEAVQFPNGLRALWFRRITVGVALTGLAFIFISLFFGTRDTFIIVLINIAIIGTIIYFGIKLMRGIGGKKTKAQQIIIVVALGIIASVVTTIVIFTFLMFDGGDKKIEYSDMDGNKVVESVNNDRIPLTVEDLGVDVSGLIQADTSCNEYVTIYGEVTDCSQWYYDKYGGLENDIAYNIADCRFGWVKDKLIKQYMATDYYGDDAKFIEVSEAETKVWEAEQVYTMTDGYDDNARLVVYDDVVFFIETDVEFTDKIINSIKTTLADQLK